MIDIANGPAEAKWINSVIWFIDEGAKGHGTEGN